MVEGIKTEITGKSWVANVNHIEVQNSKKGGGEDFFLKRTNENFYE